MIMLTAQHYALLQSLAARRGTKIEVVNQTGKQDLVGFEAGSIMMDDYEYTRLIRETGYRPPRSKGKKYETNGNRETARRMRRMK